MRGFPMLNLLAVAAVLAAMLIPLLRVDRPAPAGGRTEPAGLETVTAPGVNVLLQLRSVHAPEQVEITVDGKPVDLRGGGLERQGEAVVSFSDRALEIAVKASWPPGTPASMIELKAAPDGMEELTRNIWAEDGVADEIVRFTWRAKP